MGSFDEAQPGQLAHLAPVQAGLEVEVELLQGFDPGKAGLAQAGLDAASMTPLPFRFQGAGQEVLVIQLLLSGLLTNGIQLGIEVVHLELF